MSRKNFVATDPYIKKGEKIQINNLTFHLKKLVKEQTKLKANWGKEIWKIINNYSISEWK